MTTLSHPRLRRLSSLVVLVGAAGALAAPSALARPVDVKANTPQVAPITPHISAYAQRVKAHRIVGVIRAHNGPAPYQGAIRAGGGPLVVKKTATGTDSGGGSFSWADAGVGAGSAVLATGLLLLLGREMTRRRVRVFQA